MAALTVEKEVPQKDGWIVAHKMAAVKIYKGALVAINAAGFLTNVADGLTGGFFAGVAVETIDNSAGAAGDLNCRVYKRGNFLLNGSGFAQADVGEEVLASDNQTVTKTSAAGRAKVGKIQEIESATEVWVKIDDYVSLAVATS
jgi:hypothetical protein